MVLPSRLMAPFTSPRPLSMSKIVSPEIFSSFSSSPTKSAVPVILATELPSKSKLLNSILPVRVALRKAQS